MPYKDKNKQREYQAEWLRTRRQEWLVGKPCHYCGTVEPEFAEIHHVDPAQKTEHRIWSLSKAKREAELAKCVVACRACHHNVHAPIQHGELSGYRRKCRCEPCRAAKRKDRIKYGY